jgi:Tfp pilus assembly protein PilO
MTMSSSSRLIAAIAVVAVLAIGFWVLLLSPKREEAGKLSTEVEQLQTSLVEAQGQVTQALAAKREFPQDYQQLVVLGKAVPAGEETSSLLVELNQIADASKVKFTSMQLAGEGGESTSGATTAPQVGATTAADPAATLPATEATAALLPLGASIGPAGLGVMPYTLTLTGSFFHVADFIHGIDSLLRTSKSEVAVDGRLVTLDSFHLTEVGDSGSDLTAEFSVTTYLVPPDQGITAGASPAEPTLEAATPTSYSTPAGGEAR